MSVKHNLEQWISELDSDGMCDISDGQVIYLIRSYSSLEAKCAALAAENAGLKESRKNLAEFIHEELDADYPLNMDIKTPDTDAFLAEVRAQGVDMAACALDDVNQFNYANMLDDLAQKLRQEASK